MFGFEEAKEYKTELAGTQKEADFDTLAEFHKTENLLFEAHFSQWLICDHGPIEVGIASVIKDAIKDGEHELLLTQSVINKMLNYAHHRLIDDYYDCISRRLVLDSIEFYNGCKAFDIEVDQRVLDALINSQIDTYLDEADPIKVLISKRGLNYVLTYLQFAKFPIKRRHHLLDNDEWLVTIC